MFLEIITAAAFVTDLDCLLGTSEAMTTIAGEAVGIELVAQMTAMIQIPQNVYIWSTFRASGNGLTPLTSN